MSIRFKFRSSVNFDTVEIGNRASISIGELRARILRGKAAQQQQQGFDLVFSDAVTGLEYKSDDSQIPSGSSVIVKRVPGGTLPPTALPSQALVHVEMKECTNRKPAMDEFDVLGAADLCPVPDPNYPDFNEEFDQNNFQGNKKDEFPGSRLECKKLDSSEPNDAMPRGSNQLGNNVNTLPRIDEPLKLNKLPTNNFLAVQSSNLPLELKCSQCNHFFKDAVMIPCCQHSFCEKCIHQVLMEKGMCPKCFSSKCSVRDLLPNLSLRQAIEHFLESQMLDADIENDMHKYVPDGESGIQQVKDVSCALTVVRREFELPESSSVTGKGSNQVFGEALYEQQHWRNVPYGNAVNRELNPGLQSQKDNQLDGVGRMHPLRNDVLRDHEDFTQSTDFQGENQPVLPQAIVHDEADSNIKRRGGLWIDSGGGSRSFSGHGGYKKGIRNCYMCGSPDHLMRDCTMSHPNPMFHPGNGAFHGGMPGYAPPYWNGSSIPPFTPYANMYSNHAMMPFSASMVPVSPWAVPPYIHSMNGNLAGPGVNMRMGNMGPPRADHVGLQHCGNKRKHSNENLESEQLSDEKDGSSERHRHHPEKAHHKSQEDRASSSSHSDDNSLSRGLGRRYHHDKHIRSDVHYADERHEKSHRDSFSVRDKRLPHIERSNSGKENSGRSSDRHRHHHHGESKKYDERRGHYDSDSSLGNRSARKDVKIRVESDAQGSHKRHQSLQSESGFNPNAPVDRRGGHKEREHRDDRWKIGSGSDKDRRDEHRYHKQRRAH